MRWQLLTDWPVGQRCIPAGTTISAGEPPSWQTIPLEELPTPLPTSAKALDTAAAEQLCHWHEETNSVAGWHALHFHHTVNREQVLATVRLKKKWPKGQPAPQTTSQIINEASSSPPVTAVKEEKPRSRKRR